MTARDTMRGAIPLHLRVSLAFASGVALILVGGAVALYLWLAASYAREVDAELAQTSRAARTLLAHDAAEYGDVRGAIGHIVTELVFGDRRIVALDRTGHAFAESPAAPDVPAVRTLDLAAIGETPRTLTLPGRRLRAVRVAMPEGHALVIALDLGGFDARLARLRLGLLLGVPLALLAGAALGSAAARQALAPIRRVARAADAFGQAAASGEPTLPRLPPATAADDLAQLVGAFNGLAERLEEALARERAAVASQREFLATAAHELRTPLAVLRSEAESTRRTAGNDATALRRALDTVTTESERMSAIVGDLLLLARGDIAPLAPRRVPLYLDDLAASALARLRPLAAARGVALALGDGFEAAPAEGDPELLERAIVALLHNAIVHGRGAPVELDAGVDEAGAAWVRVRDHGPGIAAEARERIFDRFARLDPAVPGTGLGLTIVREIARAHGGTVVVESAPGVGSAFTLRLPSGAPEPAPVPVVSGT